MNGIRPDIHGGLSMYDGNTLIGYIQEDEKTKREEREKEKTLQKKIIEFQAQIQRLERRIALLRTENETLRKQKDDQKPLEDKIKALKKRNAELAAIARRLEEKAKHLQQENTKKTREEGSQDAEHLKKVFARQRAKDLAENAKSMLAKDREIEDLRKKCQELADQLANGEFYSPENVQVYEEKEELVTIIKQAAKERLQLERQLAKNKPGEVVQQVDPERSKQLKEFEEANQELQKEVEELNRVLQKTKHLETELVQKEEECEVLHQNVELQKEQNRELEDVLHGSEARNTQLHVEISELQNRLLDLEKVNEECSTLRLNLADAQQQREKAKEEVSSLQFKVDSLENLVRDLQHSAKQLKQLEHDYQDALQKVDQKQEEIERLHDAQEEAKTEHERAVTELQIRIQDLDHQCQAHEIKQTELTTELILLQKETRVQKFEPTVTVSAEIQTDAVPKRSTGTDALPLLPGNGALNFMSSSPNQNDKRRNNRVQDFIESSQFKLTNTEPNNNQILPVESDKSLDTERDDSGMESNREVKNQNEIALSESRMSSLARKGPIQVYVAKYTYSPYQHSPNENPEAELPLNAGDYVLVLGDMDEDGFFEGELVDGRRGLVPSNFIERVAEEDLSDFHAAMAVATDQSDDCTVNSIQQELDFNSSDEFEKLSSEFPEDGRKARIDTHSDLEDIEEVDESRNSRFSSGKGIPYPRQLSLDRQLTNSILLSWKPPEVTTGVDVYSYHIFINGEFKITVKGSERPKALVEGLDSQKTHRICVRCLSNRGQSKDAQCTILVGKDVMPVPSDLKVSDITANSATIIWLPGNSNYQHSISVNGREVRVVKPGVYKHTLTGLAPAAQHKVTVRAKSLTANYDDEKNQMRMEMLSASVEFKTQAGGLPDPPLNVQVEAGPQEGTLLLTWLPVTINTSGFSNGAVVTGYVVYADGRRAKEAKGPTNDHIVLGANNFQGFIPKELTVRTLSVDGKESAESGVVRLPHTLINEVTAGAAKSVASELLSNMALKMPKSPTGIRENSGNDTDEEIEAAFREAQEAGEQLSLSPVENSQFAEPFLESSSSELSDIPEVEEELIGAEESNQNSSFFGQSHLLAVSPDSTANQHMEGRKSPRPAPRRNVANQQKNPPKSPSRGDNPAAVEKQQPSPRVVPAIEITRDSSTEHGTSFEEEIDGSYRPRRSSSVEKPDSPRVTSPDVPQRQTPTSPKYNVESEGRDSLREKNLNSGKKSENTNSADYEKEKRDSMSPRGKTRISPQIPGYHEDRLNANRSDQNHKSNENSPVNDVADFDENGDVDSISGEINPPVDDNTVRLFIALFDYDPVTMSPNVESVDEELPFREGQIIKVYGEKDADGFYRGECNGHLGFVPCNMVSEIHIDDPELIDQLMKESHGNPINKSQLPAQDKQYHVKPEMHHLTPNGIPPIPLEDMGRRMVALYDYDPQELSPNVDSELELSFKAGDIVTVYGEMDEDGFFAGEVNGVRGYVPSNFLQEMPGPLSDDEVLESASMVSPSRSGESISATSRHSDGQNNTSRMEPSSPRSENLNLDTVIPNAVQVGRVNIPAPEEDKRKKKGGILNRGKNILKKLSR